MRNQKGENNSNYKHGLTGHLIFTTWLGMRQRCNDPNHVRYAKYGGIGIKLCYDILYNRIVRDKWDLDRAFNLNQYKTDMADFNG